MLVLTRRLRESIIIGDQIEVRVLSVTGDKVQLGIQAPREIPVYRKEIYLELAQERAAAGGSPRAEVDEALKRLSDDY
jgi:carbon storage regulator